MDGALGGEPVTGVREAALSAPGVLCPGLGLGRMYLGPVVRFHHVVQGRVRVLQRHMQTPIKVKTVDES